MSEQPNVLWLADMLESCSLHVGDIEQYHAGIALRRLHSVNAELLEALQGLREKCKAEGWLFRAEMDTEMNNARDAIRRALGQ